MTEDDVERVARAIYIANHAGNPVPGVDGWMLWKDDARAAIAAYEAALRERGMVIVPRDVLR